MRICKWTVLILLLLQSLNDILCSLIQIWLEPSFPVSMLELNAYTSDYWIVHPQNSCALRMLPLVESIRSISRPALSRNFYMLQLVAFIPSRTSGVSWDYLEPDSMNLLLQDWHYHRLTVQLDPYHDLHVKETLLSVIQLVEFILSRTFASFWSFMVYLKPDSKNFSVWAQPWKTLFGFLLICSLLPTVWKRRTHGFRFLTNVKYFLG